MTKGKSLVIIVLSVILGLFAVVLVKKQAGKAPEPTKVVVKEIEEPKIDLVIAKMDIPRGDMVTKELIKVVPWPAKHKPLGHIARMSDAVGRVVNMTITTGEPILSSKLAERGVLPGLAASIEKGKRAVSVKVDEVVGVAGFVVPGSRVDVLVTIEPPETSETGERRGSTRDKISVTKMILQNMEVLAIGQKTVLKENKPETVKVVTLLASPQESEQLVLAATKGIIQLVLRNNKDGAPVSTRGINTAQIATGAKARPGSTVVARDKMPALGKDIGRVAYSRGAGEPSAAGKGNGLSVDSAAVTEGMKGAQEDDALTVWSGSVVRRYKPKKVMVGTKPKAPEFKVEVIKGIERKSNRFCGPDKRCPDDTGEESKGAAKPKPAPKG